VACGWPLLSIERFTCASINSVPRRALIVGELTDQWECMNSPFAIARWCGLVMRATGQQADENQAPRICWDFLGISSGSP